MTNAITDFTQYSTLRAGAEKNDPAVLREVAGQFEALFLETMLKNMRAASLGDPLIGDSEQHEMYQGMLDQQLAVEMASGRGIGFAEMLVRQLGGESTAGKAEWRGEYTLPGRPAAPSRAEPLWTDAETFARDIWPYAERSAERLNVAPEAIVAQAALETGWGKHVPAQDDGASSFNLFGIKANRGWNGGSVTKATIEFEAGVASPQLARFRAYDGVGDNFRDHAELLQHNPRYSSVRDHGDDIDGFADALQSSGYATDPEYANKLKEVARSETMQRVISSLKNSGPQPISERSLSDVL